MLDRQGGQVKRFDSRGKLVGKFGVGPDGHPARLEQPLRIRMDATRTLWVIDRDGASLVRYDHEGRFIGRMGGMELGGSIRVAGLPEGGVAALERDEYRVTCFDADGWITARFGGEGTRPGQFEDPLDVAVSAGGEVFVARASGPGAASPAS